MKDSKTKFTKQKFLKDISKIWKVLFLLIYVVSLMGGVTARPIQAAVGVVLDGDPHSNAANTVDTIDITHTTGTGSDRLMLVGVSWNCGSTSQTITGVTFTPTDTAFDPIAFEQVIVHAASSASAPRYAAIWKSVTEPPSGKPGTVTVSFSDSVSNGIVAGVANFANVLLTAPIDGSIGATGSSTAPSVTLEELDGDELVFDTVFMGASNESQTLTAGSGQDEVWNAWIGNARAAASTEQATGASVSMDWTAGTSAVWVVAAVGINPVVAGTTYDLTMAVSPAASGTTTPAVGEHTYAEDTVVDITATPATGFEFSSWTGGVASPTSASTTVTMDGDKTVTANFTALTPTLTVNKVGNGTVNADPANTGPYTYGTAVELTAVPDSGWLFDGWSGALTGMTNPQTITMDADKTVTATFIEMQPETVYLDGEAKFVVMESGATASMDFSTGSGDNRVMLVGISFNASTTTPRPLIETVTFTPEGETPLNLTLVHDEEAMAEGDSRIAAIYYLPTENNPDPDTSGELTVTFTGEFTTGAVVGAANFTGVDQEDPLGTPNGEIGSSVDTLSVDVETLGNELVFDTIWTGGQPSWTIAATSPQEELWNDGFQNTMGGASIKDADDDTTTVTWTKSNATGYMAIVAVPINPASAAVDTPINIAAIQGVTQPVTGQTPVTAITETPQYTGTVSWDPAHATFVASTVYEATITLTPKTGYTLTGVAANFFTVAGATSVSNAADSGVVTAVFPSTSATTISIAAIEGVTVPATGGTPVTAITETAQYTGTVTWSPTDSPFKPGTAYTATITLTPKSGFTLTGVAANFFTVSGATATNAANSGVVTAVFPSTSATTISIAAIEGVTVPATGGTPVTAITETAQYTGTVTWSPTDSPFKPGTAYTATITLTPKTGYTLTGVAANFFTVSGATATNAANSGVVTAVFPETGAETTEITVDGAVSSATGNEMGASDDPLEFAHTTGTGSDRLMLVGISWNSGTSAVNIDSVEFSYGTTNLPLTEVHTEQVTVSGTVSGPRFAAIYSLENPPSGQAGTVTITFDADVPNGIVAGAINFAGVHPTTPLGTPGGAHATDTSTHPSLTFSDLASGVLVFDTAFLGGQDNTYNLTVGPDQTQRWNNFIGNARGTSSTEMAASPVTMSWTASPQTNWWALAAVPINPANYVPPTQYIIEATAGTGGTISPSGDVKVNEGADKTFTITPNSGYLIADVLVDSVSQGAISTYTFTNVVANHTITASFTLAPVPVTFTGTELLGRPTDTSISVKVVPDVDIDLYYEYGTTSGVYTDDTDTTTADAGVPKTVEITGLTPNTHYFYRMQYKVSGGETWVARDEGSFWTQRAEGSTFSFTITTDSHVDILLGDNETWMDTITDVANDNGDFHFDLGDTVAMYDNVGIGDVAGAETVYKDQYPYFNTISHSSPIFLIPGNHENHEGWHYYNDEDSRNILAVNALNKYYLNPVPDDFYSGDMETDANILPDGYTGAYYAFNWGDALFMVLNPYWYTTQKPYQSDPGGGDDSTLTGTGDTWDWTLGKEQFDWMKATLEASDAKYKFIIMHQLVSDGSWSGQEDYGHGGANTNHIGEWGGYDEDGETWGWDDERPGWGDDPIHDILVDNCVSAVFKAHDHQYAYEIKDGVVYQTLPASGFTQSFNGYTTGEGYTIMARANPGHLKVTVGPDETTVDYIRTGATTVDYSYDIEPCEDTESPTVTINQDAAQADPTSNSPINFTVVFSEPVTDFASLDVLLSGTAGATTAIVTPASADGTIYNVAVSGMIQSGTVIVSVPAGVAIDAAGNLNLASTSTDNMVTYNMPDEKIYIYLPLILKNP